MTLGSQTLTKWYHIGTIFPYQEKSASSLNNSNRQVSLIAAEKEATGIFSIKAVLRSLFPENSVMM